MNKSNKPNQKQLEIASQWIIKFIDLNRYTLETKGMSATEIHTQYINAIKFPIGMPAFMPLAHLHGLEKIRKGNGWTYVILN